MKLHNKVYDILKWVGLIALPAIGLAYSQLAEVWGLAYGQQIQTTCDVLGVLLGTLIGVSSYNYNKEQQLEEPSEE